ncbi:MAG: hypothetical protein Phyf2KO_17610 [Phycisphaerales bacterium]
MTSSAGDNAAAGAELWQRASAFAARMHTGQFRKDNLTPYASHPARVAMAMTMVFGCDDPSAIAAAYLHDTIEDTPADYDDIAEGFGNEIADIVAALTKNMILQEDARERDYDDRLELADWRARLIKLADCYDNLCDIENRTDSTPSGIGPIRKRHIARCDRAISLAKHDAAEHPETARAIEVLTSAMDSIRD